MLQPRYCRAMASHYLSPVSKQVRYWQASLLHLSRSSAQYEHDCTVSNPNCNLYPIEQPVSKGRRLSVVPVDVREHGATLVALGAIRTVDLIGKHGGATHHVGEGSNDATERIGQEDVGVLTGIGGQFPDTSSTLEELNVLPLDQPPCLLLTFSLLSLMCAISSSRFW